MKRGYPLLRGAAPGPGESDPPEVLELMHRVTLIPVVSENVNHGENHDPNGIYKMPVQRKYVHTLRLLHGDTTSRTKDSHDGEHDQACGHVKGVQTNQRHRRGRHRRVDEAEGDPEQQVADEHAGRRSSRRRSGSGRTRPAVPNSIPAVISRRAPKRPISRPEKGEIRTIGAVIGRTSTPLSIAEWPRTSCRYWGWKNITAQ